MISANKEDKVGKDLVSNAGHLGVRNCILYRREVREGLPEKVAFV